MIVPQSWTTRYRLISTIAVSGSTSTIIACTPLAVLPRSGPKYAVLSRPGSVPGRTAPRSGFAFPDELAEREAAIARATHVDAAVGQLELILRRIQEGRSRDSSTFSLTAIAAA